MEHAAVHRIVERHAATQGDALAIVCGTEALTYRDLNSRANVVARYLLDAGFRRGEHAAINLLPGVDLATALLAVLKSGGVYTWLGAKNPMPWQLAVSAQPTEDLRCHRPIDLGPVLAQSVRSCPNLPILTRPSDIACVLTDEGQPPLLVPHATIAALPVPTSAPTWSGDRTTFDFWTGLLAGMVLSVETTPALLKAA